MTHDGTHLFAAIDPDAIQDGDVIGYEGRKYSVGIHPVDRGRVQVDVELVADYAFPERDRDFSDDNPQSVTAAVWDCIHNINEQIERYELSMIDEDKAIQARRY